MQHLWVELSKSLDIKSRCARCGLTRRTSASIWVRPHRRNEFHCTMLYQRGGWEDPVVTLLRRHCVTEVGNGS